MLHELSYLNAHICVIFLVLLGNKEICVYQTFYFKISKHMVLLHEYCTIFFVACYLELHIFNSKSCLYREIDRCAGVQSLDKITFSL